MVSPTQLESVKQAVPAEVIERLEDALTAARCGKLVSIAFMFLEEAGLDENLSTRHWWSRCDNIDKMIGQIERFKTVVIRDAEGWDEE